MTDTLGNPIQPVSATPTNPATPPFDTTPLVAAPPAPAGVKPPILPAPDAGQMSAPIVTPNSVSVTPVTPSAPLVNRTWKRDLDREIATMKAHTPRAYATEADELADLNGDISRMLTMAGHNATAKELVTFLEALVKKYTTTAKPAGGTTVAKSTGTGLGTAPTSFGVNTVTGTAPAPNTVTVTATPVDGTPS